MAEAAAAGAGGREKRKRTPNAQYSDTMYCGFDEIAAEAAEAREREEAEGVGGAQCAVRTRSRA
jgi:hypothetical protein